MTQALLDRFSGLTVEELAQVIPDDPLYITVGGLKGGIGKTTTAVFLATAIARRRLARARLLETLTGNKGPLQKTLHSAVAAPAPAPLRPLLIDADPQSQTTYDWVQIAVDRGYELPWQCMPWATDDLAVKVRGMRGQASDFVSDVGGETSKMFRASVSVAPELIIPIRPNLIELRRIPATIEAAQEVQSLTGTEVFPRVLLVCVDSRAGDVAAARQFLKSEGVPVMDTHVRQGVLYPRSFGHIPDDLGDYEAVLDELIAELAA